MKVCLKVKAIILLVLLCLLSACGTTQLSGVVYTSSKEPVRGIDVLVKAELGDKSTHQATQIRKDGSFVLKGLKPNTIYSIVAICEADNTRARIDNIYVIKGKNELPENKILMLATHVPTEAIEDTSKGMDTGPGRVVPENP